MSVEKPHLSMTASQIVALKAAVKAEMLRRKYTGSVTAYGSSEYDFTTPPVTGTQVLTEHGVKIINPILAIKDVPGLEPAIEGDPIPESFNYNNLNTIIQNLAKEPVYGGTSTCKASCTGLCKGGCDSTCAGCSGCTSCWDNCWAACTNDCLNSCWSSCADSCSSSCGSACSVNCSGGCATGCTAICGGACVGGCFNTCTGCGSGCTNNCSSTCTGQCSSCSTTCYGPSVPA